MCHGLTHSLIYQIQHPFGNIFTRQNRGNIQFSFSWHCYIAQTQGCTNLFITEKRACSQMENYIINHSTTCDVAVWLIISGLNVILQCAPRRIHIQTLQVQDKPQVFKISTCN